MNIAWRQAYSIVHKGINKYIIKVIKTAKGFLSDPHSWFMHIFRDIFPQIFKKKEYFSLNHGYEKLYVFLLITLKVCFSRRIYLITSRLQQSSELGLITTSLILMAETQHTTLIAYSLIVHTLDAIKNLKANSQKSTAL